MMKKKREISRRTFVSASAKGALVLSASGMIASCDLLTGNKKGEIPKRVLGKTGLSVSNLSFGGGSQFLKNKDGEWEKHLEKAVQSGINLFDTAPNYVVTAPGGANALTSEERFGKILPPYRSKIHIMTKLDPDKNWERDASTARASVEGSLKRLKTDYIDILLIHAVSDKDTVSGIENGIYRKMMEMKQEGIIKHIGFSSMDSAERSRDLMENLDFDVVLLAMNPTKYRNYGEIALPVARKKNVGVVAIKVLRDLVNKDATAKELFEYAWTTHHVSTALVGHYGMNILEENIQIAKEYGKNNQLSLEKKELEERMAAYAGPHALCWARPGYVDGGIII
jgi:aryl-alcohol dehydrogenase-like predicted oxidoreductase